MTTDDEAIIWHAYRHRLIDAAMLRSLFPNRSPQKITRRLNTLRQARYLDRIGRYGRRRQSGGSYPEVYALGLKGAQWLRLQGVSVNARYLTQKNSSLQGRSVDHLLETTAFMVALERSAREHGDTRVIHLDEILGATRRELGSKAGLPTTLRTQIEWKSHYGAEATAADKIFGLEKQRDQKSYTYFFLEIDRGTETIVPSSHRIESRNFFRDTSFLKKMVIYAQAFDRFAHKTQYGMDKFRVLTVTTSRSRIKLMQEAYQNHVRPAGRAGLFLFTDQATVESAENLLSIPFETAAGREVLIG